MIDSWLRVVLSGFAVYRLAQLMTYDLGPFHIIQRFRDYLNNKDISKPGATLWINLAELVECPYCNGIWFSMLVTILMLYPTTLGDVFIIWLGVAGFQCAVESTLSNRK